MTDLPRLAYAPIFAYLAALAAVEKFARQFLP